MSPRLALAASSGVLPDLAGQSVLILGAPAGFDVSAFGEASITVVQDMMPDASLWQDVKVVQSVPDGPFDAALVCLPRSKDAARARIAAAMQATQGLVFVDGQKTDGAEALLKDMRKRVSVPGAVSKAHGKLFWTQASDQFKDWAAEPVVIDGRWHTVPGVFSAGAVDAGSALLVSALPHHLSGTVADLGAGWGYLSANILQTCAGIKTLHLVEAHSSALACARQNIDDARAVYHWADATTWSADRALDAVVMNPPFHTGRAAEPDLGRRFIASAARILRPGGALWMVANRHLPYETTLRETFAEVDEIAGSSKFKVLHAKAKSRPRR